MHVVIMVLLVAGAMWLSACTTTTEVNGKPVANLDPTPADGDPKRRVAIRLQLASNYYEQRNYNVALEELGRVLQIEPDNTAALGLRGLIYLELDDRAQAEENFSRAIKLSPENADLNNNYGWFLCRTGRERESVPYFQKAGTTRQYQTPALAYRNAGVCLMQVRDYPAAEQNLKRAFEIDAADLTTKFHLTRVYIALRQIERARFYHGLFEKELGETSETIWLSLRIARASGDLRSERQFADELRRRYPNSAETAALVRGVFDE
jgi:type IV pilus assembly protein PilF